MPGSYAVGNKKGDMRVAPPSAIGRRFAPGLEPLPEE